MKQTAISTSRTRRDQASTVASDNASAAAAVYAHSSGREGLVSE